MRRAIRGPSLAHFLRREQRPTRCSMERRESPRRKRAGDVSSAGARPQSSLTRGKFEGRGRLSHLPTSLAGCGSLQSLPTPDCTNVLPKAREKWARKRRGHCRTDIVKSQDSRVFGGRRETPTERHSAGTCRAFHAAVQENTIRVVAFFGRALAARATRLRHRPDQSLARLGRPGPFYSLTAASNGRLHPPSAPGSLAPWLPDSLPGLTVGEASVRLHERPQNNLQISPNHVVNGDDATPRHCAIPPFFRCQGPSHRTTCQKSWPPCIIKRTAVARL